MANKSKESNIVQLNMYHDAVYYLCRRDKRLAKVISMVGEITYSPYTKDGYAFLIHEIIEQMLSIKVGEKIYNRLLNLCGGAITPSAIERLSVEEIRETGTSISKANYILGITQEIISGNLNLEEMPSLSDEVVFKRLVKIRGIGSWTAKMYLIFVLDRQDILPFEDVAFLQAYRWMYKTDDLSKESVVKKCKKWKPYSSIAARYLYRALDMGYTKNPFHLYKDA